MMTTTSKLARWLAIQALLLGGGVGWVGFAPGEPLRAAEQQSAEANTKLDPKVKKLLEERLEVLRKASEYVAAAFQKGGVGPDRVKKAERMVLEAELELCESDAQRIAVLEKIVENAKVIEAFEQAAFDRGQASVTDALLSKADRLSSEIALERIKAKSP